MLSRRHLLTLGARAGTQAALQAPSCYRQSAKLPFPKPKPPREAKGLPGWKR